MSRVLRRPGPPQLQPESHHMYGLRLSGLNDPGAVTNLTWIAPLRRRGPWGLLPALACNLAATFDLHLTLYQHGTPADEKSSASEEKNMILSTGTRITLASKRNFPRTASALALIMLCPLLLLLTGCEWPIYRDGPGRTGQSGVNTSANTGTLQWNYSVGLGQNELPYGPVVGLASSAGGIFLGD